MFTVGETIEVWTDLPADPGASVTSDPLFFVGDVLFPSIGDPHPENSAVRFASIGQGTQLEGDKSKWSFDLVYSSDQPGVSDQSGDSNFKDDEFVNVTIARKSWSFKSVVAPRRATKFSDDGGVTWSDGLYTTQTTAGEPINSTETKYLPVLNYTRNELSTPASVISFVGSVNSDSISLDGLAVAPDAALVSDIKISEWKRDQSSQFRTVQYTFILRDDLWDLDMLNQGFYVKPRDEDSFIGKKPAGPELKLANVTKPQMLKFDAGLGGPNDEARFFESETSIIDFSSVSPDQVHYRKFQHPQRTVFAGYGFS